jgi:hypothetical protein
VLAWIAPSVSTAPPGSSFAATATIESAKIAFRLCLDSTIREDEIGASQWKLVIKWIVDLQFNEPEGMLH